MKQFIKPSRLATPPGRFADKGKWVEGKVQDWLQGKSATTSRFAWHRMPDSRAARGALSPQPADWYTSLRLPNDVPFPVYLEAKETAEKTRLPKAKIGQYGKLLMFHLAGTEARVIVYRSLHNDWTYFTGLELFPEGDEVPTSFPFVDRPLFATAAEALEDIYRV